MKVLCVQCMKLNDLPDGSEGKIRFPCPNCGFVTVVTRKGSKMKPQVAANSGDSTNPQANAVKSNRPAPVQVDADTPPPSRRPEPRKPSTPSKSLHDELFDGSEAKVGDWMVRRLDGTEAGPLTFDALKDMIRDGDIGKIDEVRRLEERYVPAAFHELTAELFNELDMAGMDPKDRNSKTRR